MLCQVLSLALFAAVANADPGGGPAPGALELGGLAAGGADFDLDDGDADAAGVLGLGGHAYGVAHRGEADVAAAGAMCDDDVRCEVGLDDGHGVVSVPDEEDDLGVAQDGELLADGGDGDR